MLENELEKAEQKKAELEVQLTEKEHELQETKDQLKANREIMKRMEYEIETWADIDYVQKSKELEKQLEEKELQEKRDMI